MDISQNAKLNHNIIADLLLANTGREFDAMEACLFFRKNYGIGNDWHVYSDALINLHTIGKAELLYSRRRDGMCRYKITA